MPAGSRQRPDVSFAGYKASFIGLIPQPERHSRRTAVSGYCTSSAMILCIPVSIRIPASLSYVSLNMVHMYATCILSSAISHSLLHAVLGSKDEASSNAGRMHVCQFDLSIAPACRSTNLPTAPVPFRMLIFDDCLHPCEHGAHMVVDLDSTIGCLT